jgi:hypothetical protein
MRPDSTSNYCGVFLDEDPEHLKRLPLESVQVHVLIVDGIVSLLCHSYAGLV